MPRRLLPADLTAFQDMFASLRSRNYRIYFIGQGVSLIGTWMQTVALSWLVYRLTGSVFLLGVIGFTSQIPTFVMAPFAGVISDRHNRLTILKLTQFFFMVQSLAMALLVLFKVVEPWHIVVLSIIFGIISAFDAPARQSLVMDLIDDKAYVGNAIALNSAIFNGARLIGPAVAGIVIAIVGEGICFLINSVSFIAVLFALTLIRIAVKQESSGSAGFRESLGEGVRYTFNSVPIRMLILLLAVMSLVGLSYIVLLPAYAKEILHGDSETLGYLMSAMGAGALAGALTMAARKSVFGLTRIIAYGVILMGLSIALASFSARLYLSMIFFFFTGLTMIMTLSAINTMLQTISDEDKRGRVMSFYAMALMGASPIGNLVAGSIASGIGVEWTMLIAGAITLLSGIWFTLNRKSLRQYIRPIYVSKGILRSLPHDVG
ncbi:MAG: MFS transporter [Bacteroidales bacterium]|nr:MFS transporter [Bacteroidales bacterium]HPS51528.1 MFS transporter [Bacteroidales bacterium]